MAKKLSELKPSDEVVIKLGARSEYQGGKIVPIDPKKQIVVTKAAYEEMLNSVDKDGHSTMLNRTVKLAGTPVYKKDATDSQAGSHQELEKVEPVTDDTKKTNVKSGKILMPKGDKTGDDEDDLGEENEGGEVGTGSQTVDNSDKIE